MRTGPGGVHIFPAEAVVPRTGPDGTHQRPCSRVLAIRWHFLCRAALSFLQLITGEQSKNSVRDYAPKVKTTFSKVSNARG